MSHVNQSGKAIYQCPPITPTLYSTTTYEYNKLGQLDMAAYANGVTDTYTYSNSQNSTCPQDNYRLCTRGLYVGSWSYTYPTSSILPHAVQTAGGNTYIYDDNGNMTSGAGRTIIYDYDNRPVNVTAGGVTTTFVYDASGARVKKNSNGVSTVYIGKLYENTPDGCIKYIFAGDQRIAMRDAAGSLVYYHTDHLGSSSVITDAAGNMVESIAYFPYGQTRINTGTKDVHHKFTGQELDSETGLYFYGARYYDPQLGRFISADTIVPNPRNPQDMNRYSYVRNNPVNYIDPTGHSIFSEFLHDIDDTMSEWGEEIEQFLNKNHVNVNAGAGGAVNSDGKVGLGAYNPETGEIFPYMPSSAAEVSTVSVGIEINSGTVSTEYDQYAEAYASDAGTLTAKDEIAELTRLIYAEAAGEYEVDNAMEGVGWVVRNRVMTQGWPDTYYGVIHQKKQFSSVPPYCGNRCSLWNQAGNPQALSGKSLSAYYTALSVSAGVYNGTIPDPTGGALFYHSGLRDNLPAKSAAFFKTLTLSIPDPIGPFRFYK